MAKNNVPQTIKAADQHVAQQIRTFRLALGISQQKVAKKVGVTFQQIQKYERGLNHITVGRLYMIAQAFDVPVQTFFPQHQLEEYSPVPHRLICLMRIVAALSEKHHDDIRDLLNALNRMVLDAPRAD